MTILKGNIIKQLLICITLGLLMSACGFFSISEDEKPLARVRNHVLYPSEVTALVGKEVSYEDSQLVVKNYIHNWINEMLLLDKAELNLMDDQKNFQKQLEDYRNSLMIYEYEKKIIEQQLDTQVALAEVERFYTENNQNFLLKEDLVKVMYVQIDKNAPKISKIQKLYKSDKPKDKESLVDYCHQFAMSYYDDDDWILFGDLLMNVPIKTTNISSYLKNHRYVELEDSVSYYFVNIKDYKIKNSISPLSFEQSRIKNIILNQRKLSLLKQMKLDLYNKALVKKDFEVYE